MWDDYIPKLYLFSYFCAMKRLHSFLLLIVALIYGAIGFAVSEKIAGTSDTQLNLSRGNTLPQKQTYLTGKKHILNLEQEASHPHYDFRVQHASKRIYPFSSNALRQKIGNLQIERLFIISQISFQQKAAFIKFNGYYLYYLRKLLI